MTKLEKKRDELAIELENSIYRMEPWQEPPDFGFCFKQGFDAALAELMPQVEKLADVLGRLLSDTQHSDHSCGDARCPVDIARDALTKARGMLEK